MRLIIAEIRKGIDDPNRSHKMPVKKEPNIVERPESIVSNPIAVPRCSLEIKSEIQAFETPSVEAAYSPYNENKIQIKFVLLTNAKPK